MRASKLASAVAAFALATSLVACGGGPVSYGQEALDEADGVKVTAQNADGTHTATSNGALEVESGDVIVISPFLDKGSIHVTITSEDGKTTVYDDDAEGKVLYTVAADPGTYNVTTTANNATGSMTIFSQSQQELIDQDAALVEELKKNGASEELIEKFEDDAADAADDADDAADAADDAADAAGDAAEDANDDPDDAADDADDASDTTID